MPEEAPCGDVVLRTWNAQEPLRQVVLESEGVVSAAKMDGKRRTKEKSKERISE